MNQQQMLKPMIVRKDSTTYIVEYETGASAKETVLEKVKKLILRDAAALPKSLDTKKAKNS